MVQCWPKTVSHSLGKALVFLMDYSRRLALVNQKGKLAPDGDTGRDERKKVKERVHPKGNQRAKL